MRENTTELISIHRFFPAKQYTPPLLAFLLATSLSRGQQSLIPGVPIDPKSPEENKLAPPQNQSIWPWKKIRELKKQRRDILKKLGKSPQHHPISTSIELGYHSSLSDPQEENKNQTHCEITLTYNSPPTVIAIALAPAFRTNNERYPFPKRFRIESRPKPQSPFRELVNWTEEDLPDPGLYPVFFSDFRENIHQLRLTFPRHLANGDFHRFALGEIYLFRQIYYPGFGENAGNWSDRQITATDSLEIPSLWGLEYLVDGHSNLGLPLSDQTVDKPDLLFNDPSAPPLPEKVELVLDLGKITRIGRVDLWPTVMPELKTISAFGFPGKITFELSKHEDFRFSIIAPPEHQRSSNLGGRVISAFGRTQGYRYIKLHLEDLPYFDGKRILGLGEIVVTTNDENRSDGKKITSTDIPDQYLDQLPRLVDGYCQNRKILSQGEWIEGLAKRRPLDERLAELDQIISDEQESWAQMRRRLVAASGILLALCLFLVLFTQRRRRRKSLANLKKSIARDLHDDVGSNLGSIALAAERLEVEADPKILKEELEDLSLLSREASASLRDVIWVVDSETITLPELCAKLADRARRVLGGIELEHDIREPIPDTVISLESKRHLMMLFKEAIHNCARHSEASKATIQAYAEEGFLNLSLHDDGIGFDTHQKSDGWGLKTMSNRAHELGGILDLSSEPGHGTKLEFRIPIAHLSKTRGKIYLTSN